MRFFLAFHLSLARRVALSFLETWLLVRSILMGCLYGGEKRRSKAFEEFFRPKSQAFAFLKVFFGNHKLFESTPVSTRCIPRVVPESFFFGQREAAEREMEKCATWKLIKINKKKKSSLTKSREEREEREELYFIFYRWISKIGGPARLSWPSLSNESSWWRKIMRRTSPKTCCKESNKKKTSHERC